MRLTRSMSCPSLSKCDEKSTATPDFSIRSKITRKTKVSDESLKTSVLDGEITLNTRGRLRNKYSITVPSSSPVPPDEPTTASSSTSSITSTTVSPSLIQRIKDLKSQRDLS